MTAYAPPLLRWIGAGLILSGGLLTRRTLLGGARRVQQTRHELAAAFEEMEAEIRLLLTPVPALLRRAHGGSAEAFFRRTREGLSRGLPLVEAWRASSEALPLPELERESVASLGARLDGGEESACAALTLAASELRRAYDRAERERGAKERLTTSICVSISLFLVVLLL